MFPGKATSVQFVPESREAKNEPPFPSGAATKVAPSADEDTDTHES
jgi:hypothetical protein